jgi:hypothetical protein
MFTYLLKGMEEGEIEGEVT